ncbi:MAG: hypothetical protein AAF677_05815, partial [Pseudomonadota bacterium]
IIVMDSGGLVSVMTRTGRGGGIGGADLVDALVGWDMLGPLSVCLALLGAATAVLRMWRSRQAQAAAAAAPMTVME